MRIQDILGPIRTLKHRLIGTSGSVPHRYFMKFLPDDPVIIEAGAHNGGDTYEIARRWPGGHVHAFEPVPELYEAVKQQTSNVKNVSYYPIALGEKNGTAEFFVSSGASDGSSSLLRPSGHLDEHPDVHFDRTLTVTVKTMDTWAAENNVSRVDFLWLDMQGAEMAALKGASKLLSTVKLIYTEVSLKPMYENGPLYPEYRAWLEAQGFSVVREALASTDFGNVVFARTRNSASRPLGS